MQDFKGKTAVITGGASGVGRCVCELFARQGMNVVMADIERKSLNKSAKELSDQGLLVTAVQCDVTNPVSVNDLADHVFDSFGNVHILCNNAGVGVTETSRRFWTQTSNDWKWVYEVNVLGVVHGIQSFVRRMLANGEIGHVVNTSSGNGGVAPLPTTPIYASSKAAVTSLTEVLHSQFLMDKAKLQAHLLFPGPYLVNTNILNSQRNRPAGRLDNSDAPSAYVSMEDLAKQAGIAGQELKLTQPEDVAQDCLRGIRENKFWILPASEKLDQTFRDRNESLLARQNPELPK